MKVSYIIDVIIAITDPLYEWRSIDTRRIDSHIHQMNKLPWFQAIVVRLWLVPFEFSYTKVFEHQAAIG